MVNSSVVNRLNHIEEVLSNTETRVNLIGNCLIRHEEHFESSQEDMKMTKRNKAHPNLVVRGLIEKDKETQEECIQDVVNFFKEEMSIDQDILVKKAYRMGPPTKGDRPMLVRLSDVADKAVIFKSVSNLKVKSTA